MNIRPDRPMPEYHEEFTVVLELHNAGDYDHALIEAAVLEKEHKNESPIMGLIGIIYFMKDDYANSSEYFKKATILSPKSEMASLGLFHSLWSLHREDEAFDEMKRYLSKYKSEEYTQLLKEMKEEAT